MGSGAGGGWQQLHFKLRRHLEAGLRNQKFSTPALDLSVVSQTSPRAGQPRVQRGDLRLSS